MAVISANRIHVDTGALAHNYRLIQEAAGHAPVLAMVKGDGYGHGMVRVAKTFSNEGCRNFGVAELCEGIELRQAGLAGEIYVTVGFSPDDAAAFFTYNLTPVVFSTSSITALATEAVQLGKTIGVHLKVDCGMGRLGVGVHEVEYYQNLIGRTQGVTLVGILSHFPESENVQTESTKQVFSVFSDACKVLGNDFPGIKHIANSGAVLNFPETCCDMVRSGIALYGYSPDGVADHGQINGQMLRPAMALTTRVAMVKEMPAGAGISYGHTYVTNKPTRIAVLPVGYEDGYPRLLSNNGEVLIKGQRAPILGRVCMNLTMIDITAIENVQPEDEVVLLGAQGVEKITADDIGNKIGTISYEILCMLGKNNQRLYIE